MGGYRFEGRSSGAVNVNVEGRGLRWEGVSVPYLFLSCLHEMNMARCHTKTHQLSANLYCRAPKKKKKGIVEVSDCTKRARKLLKRPHRCRRSENHNSRIAEPTGLDCFVKCGMYALANSWVEVGFHLGVTTSYPLTEFVVFLGAQLLQLIPSRCQHALR